MEGHAGQRAAERLQEAGVDPQLVYRVGRLVAQKNPGLDLAVLLAELPKHCGDTQSGIMERESNGNQVWGICRQGRLCTIMLRRSEQPRTPEAFGVQKVARLAK